MTFVSPPSSRLRARAWNVRHFITRALGRIILQLGAVAIVGGIAALLILHAPGFNSDERELDPVLGQSSRERLHASRMSEKDLLPMLGGFLRSAIHGDFGRSRDLDVPVRDLITERGAVTLRILFTALGLSWLVGLAWSAAVSCWRSRLLRTLSALLTTSILCLPIAVLAVIGWNARWPAEIILAVVLLPKIVHVSQDLIAKALQGGDVVSARSRGLRQSRVLGRYVLPRIARPLLAWMAATVALAIGAIIPVEVVCDVPGIGQLAWRSALARDLPVLLVLTAMVAIVIRSANAFTAAAARSTEV